MHASNVPASRSARAAVLTVKATHARQARAAARARPRTAMVISVRPLNIMIMTE